MIDKNKEPEFITPRETADILRMRPSTLAVWRCRHRYDLPYLRVGKRILYRRADVMAFANRETVAK